jgi:hypothetical protein
MIHLKRPLEEPAVLKSKAMQDFRKKLGEFYLHPGSNKQKKTEWRSDSLGLPCRYEQLTIGN